MVLTSFDQENHDRILKEEYTRQGELIGEKRGIVIGEERGIAIGEEQGESRTKRIFKLHAAGKAPGEIAAECNVSVEKVIQVLE